MNIALCKFWSFGLQVLPRLRLSLGSKREGHKSTYIVYPCRQNTKYFTFCSVPTPILKGEIQKDGNDYLPFRVSAADQVEYKFLLLFCTSFSFNSRLSSPPFFWIPKPLHYDQVIAPTSAHSRCVPPRQLSSSHVDYLRLAHSLLRCLPALSSSAHRFHDWDMGRLICSSRTSTSPVDTLACGTRPGCVRQQHVIEALRVTPSDCSAACESRSDCLAFQTGSGVCNLLSVKAAQTAFIDNNNECTQYSIQNKDCSNPYAWIWAWAMRWLWDDSLQCHKTRGDGVDKGWNQEKQDWGRKGRKCYVT